MKEIILKASVKVGEKTVERLQFSDPKVKHILAIGETKIDTTEADVKLCSALTGVPVSVLKELPPSDWYKVRQILEGIYAEFYGFKEEDDDFLPPPEAQE